MPKSAEEKKEYMRVWRLKNKEKIAKKKSEYYQKNIIKFKKKRREYYVENKEEIAVRMKKYSKEYAKTPACKKSYTISNWKKRGLICEDYDSLYCHYINATECEMCDVTFGEFGDGSGTFKCCDHNHKNGQFRNFICHTCNVRRG